MMTFGPVLGMMPGSLRRRLLSVLMVVALLLCHGALGALHQVSWPAAPEGAHHATVAGDAAAASQGHAVEHPWEHRAGHPTGPSDYAAALFSVLLLGTVLALLLGAASPWGSAAGPDNIGLTPSPAGLPPPRGPTVPLLQVFRF